MKKDEKTKVKNPRNRNVSSVVLLVLAFAAFFFYLVFFLETIEGLWFPDENSDIGTGFQIAFGIIFSAVFGILQLAFSAFSALFAALALKISDFETRIKPLSILIINAIFAIFTVISFIVVCIVA